MLLLPVILLMAGCVKTTTTPTPSKEPEETLTTTPSNTTTPPKTTEDTTPADSTIAPDTTFTVSELRDLRVIVSSDIHCTDLQEWYNVGFRKPRAIFRRGLAFHHGEPPSGIHGSWR